MRLVFPLVFVVLVTGSAGAQDDFKLAPNMERHIKKHTKGRAEALRVGDKAPLFTLKALDGKSETDLKELSQERPVVLFFGSYT